MKKSNKRPKLTAYVKDFIGRIEKVVIENPTTTITIIPKKNINYESIYDILYSHDLMKYFETHECEYIYIK